MGRSSAGIEVLFERALRRAAQTDFDTNDAVATVQALIASSGGPSLSKYITADGTIGELREFAIQRSAYQLKEADPHTWVLPRLHGRAKAAMVTFSSTNTASESKPRCTANSSPAQCNH